MSPILEAEGYRTVYAPYSTMPGRDSFGVLIAYPIDKYKLLNHGRVKVGAHIIVPDNIADLKLAQPSNGAKVDGNVYHEAITRDSELVWLQLKHSTSGKIFYAMTYHMPCAFWWIPVMTLQLDAVRGLITRITDGAPYIFGGDFNLTLGSPLYDFLTNNTINESIQPFPEWQPTSDMRMDAVQSNKPTNKAINPRGDLFCETLYYVFYHSTTREREFES